VEKFRNTIEHRRLIGAVNIILGTLICATLIGEIFNETVFYTLFATLQFVAIVMLMLKFYYKRKI
jgi:hypothetical protein